MDNKTVKNSKVKESFGRRFGALVHRYRTEQGLSLAEASILAFGDRTRVPRISELENGKVNRPHAKTIAALAKALEIPKADLDYSKFGQDAQTQKDYIESEDSDDDELSILLSTADLQFQAVRTMGLTLSTEIEQIELDREAEHLLGSAIERGNITSLDGIKRMLLSPLAQDVMMTIWRESEFVPEEALSKASGQKLMSNYHLTRNSLTNLICDMSGSTSARDVSAVKRTVDRIVQALQVLGLVEQDAVRANLKPIKATKRLDAILRKSLAAVAKVYERQLSIGSDPGSIESFKYKSPTISDD